MIGVWFEPDVAPMPVDNPLANSQSNSGSCEFLATVQALEDNKYFFPKFRVDSNTIIFNRKDPSVFLSYCRNLNYRCSTGTKFDTVFDQVLKQTLNL